MSKAIQKLSHLIASLQGGNDELRLYAAQSAFNFKHSWLEMADALLQVRDSNAHGRWGYDTFLAYAEGELGLKRALVDKLTTSFSMIQQHAPERLSGEEDAPIPSYQSLDYYARATGALRFDGSDPTDAPAEPMSPELSGQLHAAVFDECCTHKQLKDRFEPILRPKSAAEEQNEAVRKLLTTTKRLQEQLEEIESLDADLLRDAADILTRLQSALEDKKEMLKESLGTGAEKPLLLSTAE